MFPEFPISALNYRSQGVFLICFSSPIPNPLPQQIFIQHGLPRQQRLKQISGLNTSGKKESAMSLELTNTFF